MEDKKNLKVEPFDTEVLREYDIRGIVNKNLNTNTAYTLGRTFGSIVFNKSNEKKICVGYDGRLSSPDLHDSLCQGLVDSGNSVISIGICPTPMLYYSIYNQNADAGIMVTGSHNPPEYNGFKMVMNERPFYSNNIYKLQTLVNKNKFQKGGSNKSINMLDDYVDRILQNIHFNKKLKVAWDPGNGSVGITIRRVIDSLDNTENFLINEKVDGTFPNHHPDPIVPKNLLQLQELVKKNKCDIGLAFDGDGDRLGIIDDKCQIVWADRYMILLAEEISKKYDSAPIIMDIKSSKVFFDEVKKMGCKPIMYRSGHSVIKDEMKRIKSPLSGELSGHVMYHDDFLGYDDAMYVGLRFLKILSQKDENLSDIMKKYPKTFSTPEIRIEVEESKKFQIVEEIKERLKKNNSNILTIDGIRVDLKEGWWGIRASNTQNSLTVRIEANDEELLKKLALDIENELELSGIKFKFFS